LISVDSIANLVSLEIGSVVFLSIELYQEVISKGTLERVIDNQSGIIAKFIRNTLILRDVIKQNKINYNDVDIDNLFKDSKALCLGDKETRLLAIKNFLSDRLFGSNITALLNSVVILLSPISDPVTSIVTGIIPVSAFIITGRIKDSQFLKNILSFVAIASVVGQMVYFAWDILYVYSPPIAPPWLHTLQQRLANYTMSSDGLVLFSVGFSIAMLILTISSLYEFIRSCIPKKRYEIMNVWPQNAARVRLLRQTDPNTGRYEEINIVIKRLLDSYDSEKV
jgi:hypothetical protein